MGFYFSLSVIVYYLCIDNIYYVMGFICALKVGRMDWNLMHRLGRLCFYFDF
ncbi:hypothetical protein HanRHA438_Chr17g0791581 [Helianthus annuus]|nr:hypothetical protein HanRHA438_Chr17g0791581 [Helianthus annuus]